MSDYMSVHGHCALGCQRIVIDQAKTKSWTRQSDSPIVTVGISAPGAPTIAIPAINKTSAVERPL